MGLLRKTVLGLLLALAPVWGGMPAEVSVTVPTKLELLRDGRVSGTVSVRVGEKLEVIEMAESYVKVRYRNLSGRILAAHTDLLRQAREVPAAGVPSAPSRVAAPTVAPATKAPEVAPRPHSPSPEPLNPIARALAGKLVAVTGGGVQRQDPARLAGVKFFALYFSASWCGPCRQFTPELVDAYGKIRSLYPEFEVVLMNRDKSPAEMAAYMRDDRMPWPAIAWEALRGSELNRYAGRGVPCLVLIDANGKVLSDSYRFGRFVGPDTVLDDTWKILRDYRKRHPRPKI